MIKLVQWRVPLFMLLTIAVYGIAVWLTHTPVLAQDAALVTAAVMADVLIGVPLLFYLLVARPHRMNWKTILPFLLVGYIVLRLALPAASQTYVQSVESLIAIVEIGALAFGLWKARQLYMTYCALRPQHHYPITALEQALQTTFRDIPLMAIVMTECALVFLALGGWFMRFIPRHATDRVFSYHRTSIYNLMVVVMCLVSMLELAAVHLLLHRYSPTLAWLVFAMTVYGIVWILGDASAARLHPIIVSDNTLWLRTGLRWHTTVPLSALASIERPTMRLGSSASYLNMALMGEPKMVLVFRTPVEVRGLFWIRKTVTRIGIYVDDPAAFREAIAIQSASAADSR